MGQRWIHQYRYLDSCQALVRELTDPDEDEVKEQLRAEFEAMLRTKWPECQLKIFGSSKRYNIVFRNTQRQQGEGGAGRQKGEGWGTLNCSGCSCT